MYLIIILSVAIFLITSMIFNICFAYRYTFKRDPKKEPSLMKGLIGELPPERERKRELIGELASIPCDDVYITAYDGVKLRARYYAGEPDRPVAIGFHGYRSSALRDLAGLATHYYYKSYDVIIVDERAHGESGGKEITFGAKERFDVLYWARYARDRFGKDKKIILFGLSMGAASVILATELDLPENVKLAVADCPFSSASRILERVSRDRGIPRVFVSPAITVSAKLLGGFSLSDCEPVRAIKNSRIPIFLVHGTGDTLVPCEMSDELAEAGSRVTYYKVEGAPHLLAMMCDEEGYLAALDKHEKSILND
jgi:pimeloyl-ACP methyl ester carboxylesterase